MTVPGTTVLVMCPSLSHYSLGGALGEWEHWKRGASGREEHWGGRSIGKGEHWEGRALGSGSIGEWEHWEGGASVIIIVFLSLLSVLLVPPPLSHYCLEGENLGEDGKLANTVEMASLDVVEMMN